MNLVEKYQGLPDVEYPFHEEDILPASIRSTAYSLKSRLKRRCFFVGNINSPHMRPCFTDSVQGCGPDTVSDLRHRWRKNAFGFFTGADSGQFKRG